MLDIDNPILDPDICNRYIIYIYIPISDILLYMCYSEELIWKVTLVTYPRINNCYVTVTLASITVTLLLPSHQQLLRFFGGYSPRPEKFEPHDLPTLSPNVLWCNRPAHWVDVTALKMARKPVKLRKENSAGCAGEGKHSKGN